MDNVFTKSLQYLCPSKIDHVESEAYIAEIAKVLLPHEYIDEICREWKKLQASKDYFESGIYSQYYEYYRKELELIMYGVKF